MSQELDAFLSHYGVKGMKWGVRKDRKSGSSGSSGSSKKKNKAASKVSARLKREAKETIKKPTTSDARKAKSARKTVKKHGTDALSNSDLQQLVNRMNLEQQYTNLMDSDKAQKARKSGRKYVTDFIADVGKEAAKSAVNYAVAETFNGASNRRASNNNSNFYPSQRLDRPELTTRKRRKAIGR